jgi:hypothetical protein
MDGESRVAIKRAWPKLLRRFGDAKKLGRPWVSAKGIASAIIVTTSELGWSAPLPQKFLLGDKDSYCDIEQGGAATAALIEAATIAAVRHTWAQAAKAYAGSGLEEGPPDLTIAKAVQRWLNKEGHNFEAGLVSTLVRGGSWPAARHTQDGRCNRCGAIETAWHRYYECPANDASENKLIHNKRWMAKEAAEDPGHECLWFRGLQPFSLWAVDASYLPVHDSEKIRISNTTFAESWPNCSHTDGTGGPHDQPHGIRRAAAVAIFAEIPAESDASATVGGWRAVASRVPGRQTSQRAEVQALLLRAQEQRTHQIPWGTDSLSTLNGQRATGEARWPRCAGVNGDLWEQVYDALDLAEQDLQGHHCYSHRKVSAVGSKAEGGKNITAQDWLCNGIADTLAAEAAKIFQPQRMDVIRFAGSERRAFAVMRRLAFIEAECIRAAPDLVPLAPQTETEPASISHHLDDLDTQIAGVGHQLIYDGRWVRCRICCKRRNCRFMKWGNIPCCAGGFAALGKRRHADPDSSHAEERLSAIAQARRTDAQALLTIVLAPHETSPNVSYPSQGARRNGDHEDSRGQERVPKTRTHAFDEEDDPFEGQHLEDEQVEPTQADSVAPMR